MFEALLIALPSYLLEGGILAFIVELLFSHHARTIERDIRNGEKLLDERLDKIEQDLIELKAENEGNFQTVRKDIGFLFDYKQTRPPRD